MKIALKVTADDDTKESLRIGYISLADFQQLTDEEAQPLRLWNDTLARIAAAVGDLDITTLTNAVAAEGELVSAVQRRAAAEADALAAELKAAGF